MDKPRMTQSMGRWYCVAMVPRHHDGSALVGKFISGSGQTPDEALHDFQLELRHYIDLAFTLPGPWPL